MKPVLKLLLVQLIVLAGFSLFLVAWKIYSSRQYHLFLKASQVHCEELIDQVTNRHTSQYIRPLKDNSEWDETVKFIEKPDPEFEKVNLQTILPLYSIKSILVYNAGGKQISAVSDSQDSNIQHLLDPYDVTRILSNKKPKCHFFLKSENQLFEVFGATVVTTYDTAHFSTPR